MVEEAKFFLVSLVVIRCLVGGVHGFDGGCWVVKGFSDDGDERELRVKLYFQVCFGTIIINFGTIFSIDPKQDEKIQVKARSFPVWFWSLKFPNSGCCPSNRF